MSELATTENVADRLGRDLTEGEERQVDYLLAAVTDLIAGAGSQTEATWVDDLDEVPARKLRALCVEVICRAMVNPHGIAAENETLGAHSYSRTFPRGAEAALALTSAEELAVGLALRGSGSGSAKVGSIATEAWDGMEPEGGLEWIGRPPSER